MLDQPSEPDRRLPRRPPRRRHDPAIAARPTAAGSGSPAHAGNNLKNITVEFPLGVLCLVTGVSGAGKSTLVQDTLYRALCRRMRRKRPRRCRYDDVFGDGQIDDVMLVDQSPIGRSPRSNPVTYIKAFDEIRAVFAETIEARTHNYTAGHFSFNVDGGRCTRCEGDGYIAVDMQFLADVFMKCPECGGRRYRKEILEVKYRGRNIAEVLEMTVREAFAFFRGQPEGAGPAQAADRRRARLPAARPAGQHALRRRGPAAQAGRLPVRAPSAAARCSSSTSRRPACTLPTWCSCSTASRPCSPSAIR